MNMMLQWNTCQFRTKLFPEFCENSLSIAREIKGQTRNIPDFWPNERFSEGPGLDVSLYQVQVMLMMIAVNLVCVCLCSVI